MLKYLESSYNLISNDNTDNLPEYLNDKIWGDYGGELLVLNSDGSLSSYDIDNPSENDAIIRIYNPTDEFIRNISKYFDIIKN